MAKAGSTEKVVREIRRHTRRRFSAEEKIRIVLEGLRGEESIAAALPAAKAWRRISITAGAKNSLRPARSGCWAIRHAKRRRRKSRTCAAKTASSSRSWPRRSSRIAYSKKSGGLRCGGRYVRLTAGREARDHPACGGLGSVGAPYAAGAGGSPVHVLRVVSPLPGRGRGRVGPPRRRPPGATGTVSRCGSGTASWRPPWPIR